MSSDRERKSQKDQGPQGTQVFSRDEVSQLIDEASSVADSGGRAELTGLSEGVRGQSHALSSTKLVVGRSAACDICLDDASVSSEHARLSRDAKGWRVVNLLSTNGTFVNEEKVSSQPLNDGDRVRFGRVEFRFHDPDQGGGQGAEAGRDMFPTLLVAAVALMAVAGLAIWLL